MFERFTAAARAAVVTAQEVARETGATRITTAHLTVALASGTGAAAEELATRGADRAALLARLGADDGLDAEALAALGIDLDAVRRQADTTFGAGALDRGTRHPASRGRHMPFDPDAKKTLEVALREAIRLGGRRIEAGHVLLAVLRLDGTDGHALLLACGIDPTELGRAVERRLADPAAA
ncbi:MAG TPA: Clp protease N-terminal domain-containing protein [Cellulomonas sp.]